MITWWGLQRNNDNDDERLYCEDYNISLYNLKKDCVMV